METDNFQVYCLYWLTSSGIRLSENAYTDHDRAVEIMETANKKRNFLHKLMGNCWRIRTLNVRAGKKGE